MKKAVIDIGSNSVRLLVVDCKEDKIRPICRRIQTTRLGSYSADSKRIARFAMRKTVKAVQDLKKEAEHYECEEIYAIATSAVREAENRDDFISKIRKDTDIDVFVLSGEDEANLSFLGAKKGLDAKDCALVIDVGGGSTELSFGKDEIVCAKSFPVGAVKMTKHYLQSDPPREEEITSFCNYLDEVFSELTVAYNKFDVSKASIIGVGGTLTTLAAMIQELSNYDPSKIHNYSIEAFQIENILYKLLPLKQDDIKDIPGLSPERADIIVAGVLIVFNIVKKLGLRQITISESDLMEGFLYKNMK